MSSKRDFLLLLTGPLILSLLFTSAYGRKTDRGKLHIPTPIGKQWSASTYEKFGSSFTPAGSRRGPASARHVYPSDQTGPLAPDGQSSDDDALLDRYVEQVSEFSSRARANVYFPNPQSIFNGVQFSFVNVGSGNLTFLRRDMVASGRIPLVLARVYDSSADSTEDFGPGWRLSVAETISPGVGKAQLTTESGSVIDFVQDGENSFRLERDYPSDYTSLVRTAPDTLQASLRTGFVRIYKLIRGEFRLTQVIDRSGNGILLTYDNGSLAKMQNANHWIALTRGKKGRILFAQDDQARRVSYVYDEKGRLVEADDLGGNAWKYKYGGGDKLTAALDPLQRLNFAVSFDDAGRVGLLHLPSGAIQYQHDQASRSTTVSDRKHLTSLFFQNADGITTRVVNPLEEATSITLDSGRNVTSLIRAGLLVESMGYDGEHRLRFRQSITDSGTVNYVYRYDPVTGLLAGIHPSDGADQTFAYDKQGSLIVANLLDGPHHFEISAAGDLVRFSAQSRDLTFTSDADGLIGSMTDEQQAHASMKYKAGGELAVATFPDGTRAEYKYMPSGLRAALAYKDGRRVEYEYDPAGNLTSTKVFDSKGKQVGGQKFEMNGSYQLTRWVLFDGTETSFQYDANGNLTQIAKGDSITRFQYDALNRLLAVNTPDGQRLTYDYKPGERSLVEQYEHASVPVADVRDTGFTFSNPFAAVDSRPLTAQFGSVRFSENLGSFQLTNADGSEIVRPHEGIESALAKLHLYEAGMTSKAVWSGFNAPFNNMFVPAEYLTINCCVECYFDSGQWICPECQPPPPSDAFTTSAAQTITDGQQGAFSVSVTSGTPTAYAWSFSAPSGAGNAPQVNFTSPHSQSTGTDGHWFALPDRACPATSQNSTYSIIATVTFDDGQSPTGETQLTVTLPTQGGVTPSFAAVLGLPAMAADNNGVWHVTGLGTLRRDVPTSYSINVPQTSQFYNKLAQHEQVHVDQWKEGTGHLFGDLFLVNNFFLNIADLTAASQSSLISQIRNAQDAFDQQQAGEADTRHDAAEHEAYVVSDPINPQYLYQNCGHY